MICQQHYTLAPNHKPIVVDPQLLVTYAKDGILLENGTM